MTKHMSVSLDDHSAAFIENQIEAGHFASLHEVVQAGLRLLEHEAKTLALRTALDQGAASGRIYDLDRNAFLAELRRDKSA